MTHTDSLIRYLRSHPGASSLDIIRDLLIVNTTGRISDARERGVDIECRKVEGVSRYFVVEKIEPIKGEQTVAW